MERKTELEVRMLVLHAGSDPTVLSLGSSLMVPFNAWSVLFFRLQYTA